MGSREAADGPDARRDRGERGAVLVEAAIVIPILMMITLGIIEYGGAYREDAAVADARPAPAPGWRRRLPKTDFGCTAGPRAPTPALTVAAAVSSALQSFGANAPQQLWIYKVGVDGQHARRSRAAPTVSVTTGTRRRRRSARQHARYRLARHEAERLRAAGPPDQIGVYVKAKHTAVTRMFGGDRTLTGTTIMRLEPYVGTLACASS